MKKFFVFAIAIIMLMVAGLPASAQEEESILEIAENDERFNTLIAVLQTTELLNTLQAEGPFTVFAPTDDAFNSLPVGILEELLIDPSTLGQILTYHVISGEVKAADLDELNGQEIPTLQGEKVAFKVDGENVMINDANIIVSDIQASNGVIHVIDKILIPPTVAATMGFSEEPTPEAESTAEPTAEPTAEVPTAEPTAEVPTAEPTAELVPTPSTIPNTGADKRQRAFMPALMILSGLLLLAVAYIFHQPAVLE